MLELKVRDGDREVVLQFEHSLLSLSKWESKHKKPFAATPVKPNEELIDYFQDMLLSPEPKEIVFRLSPQQMDELSEYINDPQTASSVPQDVGGKPSYETTTSELVYYWMVELQIPFQPAESWHFNRLMMLIQITSYKKQPEKKRNPREFLSKWREQNAAVKQRLGTSG